MMNKIERFIARIRESAPWQVKLFTEGGCWQFYLILRELWPDAQPWYAMAEGHVYTKIGRAWYDIRGKHLRVTDSVAFTPMDPRTQGRAHRWLPRMAHLVAAVATSPESEG